MATILHIEDDPQSQLLVRKLLSAAGHRVVESRSGLDGARLAAEQAPDLALVDINIPDLDGYEVALLLKARMPNLPVVAITAEGDPGTARAVGFTALLRKPLDVRSFVKTVESYLSGAAAEAHEAPEASVLRAQGERIAAHLEAKAQALSVAEARLIEADTLRKSFYRNVSHELATPLTPLVGYLAMLSAEELGALNPGQKKAVGAMREALGRLRGTIDSLLDVTQLETGRTRFDFAPYDFAGVLREVLAARADAVAARGVRVAADLPEGPVAAVGDAERVRRALGHIVDNALKFGPDGGTLAVECRVSPSHAEVLVADDGPGVPPMWLGRIFEPFVQVDGSVTRRHGGAGVGLAVVRGVAEAHDGAASAEVGGRSRVAGKTLPGLVLRMQVARNPKGPAPSPFGPGPRQV
ncbi:MAG: response regulator [Myxococcales bacterium]|nr:response regulator [Myxococcales bacterium]